MQNRQIPKVSDVQRMLRRNQHIDRKVIYNICQSRRVIPDDWKYPLTEQKTTISDHNNAMIIYIGRYGSLQI